MNIGITGSSGFIGKHLYNTLSLKKSDFNLITLNNEGFSDEISINNFVKKSEVIIHLAGINRHKNEDELYKLNIELTKKLIDALQKTNSNPHIIFASSTQEELDNSYGLSKKKSRELLSNWAKNNKARLSSLLIPNVFGPFGKPFYNSVVATFCYQLANNEKPTIKKDSKIQLIYVGELVSVILSHIINDKLKSDKTEIKKYDIASTNQIIVSDLLDILLEFKNFYFKQGIIPNINDSFRKNLLITFLCFINHKKWFPFELTKNSDNRGSFTELIKFESEGQVSFSITKPGITRGNHFHTRKIERFIVISGSATIELRKIGTKEKIKFLLDGKNPSFVDMPIWYTHNITNVGSEDLLTIFWINESYNDNDPDTYFEEV